MSLIITEIGEKGCAVPSAQPFFVQGNEVDYIFMQIYIAVFISGINGNKNTK